MTLDQLNNHVHTVRQLKSAHETLDQFRTKKRSIVASLPSQWGAAFLSSALDISLAAQERSVADLEAVASASEAQVKKYIDGICDPYIQQIFTLRFLCGMMWKDVAISLGGISFLDSVRMTCYRYVQDHA